MPELPSPTAPRLRRGTWRDLRLVVGVLLVLLSVALGARVVAAADDTVAVWGAARDIGAGVTLGEDDLERREVRLDGDLGRYLAAGELPDGYVLTRPVGAGELLPAAALQPEGQRTLRRLPITVDEVSTTGLDDRAVVDLYVVPAVAPGSEERAGSELVLAGVTVDQVARDSGAIAASREGAVVLLVTPEEGQQVLDAQARGSLRLLQVPGSGDLAAAPR